MKFNAEEHKVRQEIINSARLKWPTERNITVLYERGCQERGIEVKLLSSNVINHLPTPKESAIENPETPNVKICPECDRDNFIEYGQHITEKTFVLYSICPTCKDSEDGKYKTMFKCYECGYFEKSKKYMITVLNELEIDFGSKTKAELGIKTITDEGLK